MNRILKNTLLVTLTVFALATIARVASAADDMGGMKMDKGKADKTEKMDMFKGAVKVQ